MPLPIDNVVLGLKDCTGASTWVVHDFIAKRIPLGFDAITANKTEEFSHPQLKEIYFAEIQHFVSRALYHLTVGKRLIALDAPTWGLVSFYYSSFFAAQAAIRLRGTAFFRLSYDDEIHVAPTYRLDALNFVTDKFSVRRTSQRSTGEHQRLWRAFYDSFNGFTSRAGYADLSRVVDATESEQRLAELHRRHLVNYVPGVGYYEFRGDKELRRVVKGLERDVREHLQEALDDPDGQLEAGAFLRFRLCCGLLREIAAARGTYAAHHRNHMDSRKQMLTALECPQRLARHLTPELT